MGFVLALLGSSIARVAPEVLGALAQLGGLNDAIDLASLRHDPTRRSRAFRCIAVALQRGADRHESRSLLERACDVAESIEDTQDKARALCELVKPLLDVALEDRARGVADEASRMVGTEPRRDGKPDALVRVAEALILVADHARGQDLASKALTMLDATGIGQAVRLLPRIAVVLHSAGKHVEATKVLQRYHREFRRLSDWERPVALVELARTQYERGGSERALNAVNRAAPLIRLMKPEWQGEKDAAACALACLLGDMAEFDGALEAARSIRDGEIRSAALGSVAMALAAAGKSSSAASLVRMGLEAAEQVAGDVTSRIQMGASFARALWSFGGMRHRAVELARTAFAQAERIRVDSYEDEKAVVSAAEVSAITRAVEFGRVSALLNSLENHERRARAYIRIGRILSKGGHTDAAEYAANAARLAEEMLPEVKAELLGGAACGLAAIGHRDLALKVAERAWAVATSIEGPFMGPLALAFLQKMKALALAAEAMATSREFDRALEVTEELGRSHDPERHNFEWVTWKKVRTLMILVRELVSAGRDDQARAVAMGLLEDANRVAGAGGYHAFSHDVSALVAAARALNEAGMVAEAAKTSSRAVEIGRLRLLEWRGVPILAGNSEWTAAIENLLSNLVVAIRISRMDLDIEGWALEVAAMQPDPTHRAVLLATMARILAEEGENERGLRLLRVAIEAARLSDDQTVRSVLAAGATTLAAVEEGAALRRIQERLGDIEAWAGADS